MRRDQAIAANTARIDQALHANAAVNPWARRRSGGWPELRVIAAAAILHLMLIVWLVLDWRHPTPSPLVSLQVRLVPAAMPVSAAPPPTLAAGPRAEAQIEQAPAEAPLGALDGAAHEVAAEPAPAPAPLLRPTPKPPVHRRAESAPVRADRPAVRSQNPVVDALGAGDALYSVVVDSSGRIGAVTLIRSSGTPAFDQVGETMIRTTMNFPRPADADAATFFSVTLHFTPEH